MFSGMACRAEEIPNERSITLPANMKGTWQVSDVLFDLGKNETDHKGIGKKYFIPIYLGRIINITSKKITINNQNKGKILLWVHKK